MQQTLLGLPLSSGITVSDLCQLLDKKDECRLVTFVNPSAWSLAQKQADYAALLQQIHFVIPASQMVSFACATLTGAKAKRIEFELSSLADPFFKAAVEKKSSLMLIGGQPAVDERVSDKLNTHYKGINTIGGTHGYGELAQKVALVMEKKPDAVLVAMGMVRNEVFLVALRDAGYKGMAITCGDFFDHYLKDAVVLPAWAEKYHLRFVFRLMHEPARLWQRYVLDYPSFMGAVLTACVQKFIPAKSA
jgi:N-acetylglucosaminyldiphosphoundecaprenol N-acetyl-beta-D-mannosaminyltransferase